MDKVNKAVGMARKYRLDEIAKLIQDQAYRIEALEARIAKADALAEAVERDKRSAKYEDYHNMLKTLTEYRAAREKE